MTTTSTTAPSDWVDTVTLAQRTGNSPFSIAHWPYLATFPSNARRRFVAGSAEWDWSLIEPWCQSRTTGRRASNYALLQRAKSDEAARLASLSKPLRQKKSVRQKTSVRQDLLA
jgi:hypothetical protein